MYILVHPRSNKILFLTYCFIIVLTYIESIVDENLKTKKIIKKVYCLKLI